MQYTDELPTLHKEIKRDVHWIGSIHAKADRVVKICVQLTEIVKATKGSAGLSDGCGVLCILDSCNQHILFKSIGADALATCLDALGNTCSHAQGHL